MSSALPKLYLARHGDTAWTDSHQHTGRTDLPLNERGEEHARQLGERLRGFSFVRVFTSPLQRASKTCELAGFGAAARWCGLAPAAGRVFFCRPASVGVLGFEHESLDQPIIRLWNHVSELRE
jgi:phosphohistidine phosphatase SixA